MKHLLAILGLGAFFGLIGCDGNKGSSPTKPVARMPSPTSATPAAHARDTKPSPPGTVASPAPSAPAPRKVSGDPSRDDAAGANGKGTRNVSSDATTVPQLL